ncbi:unnamed protein product [Durusdinium trenchii]|uniref:Uncharacterized protein n=1 Tax=Durusdinium trenchii TaxID=1381693 RepID=A0ABP0MFT8_9DINO
MFTFQVVEVHAFHGCSHFLFSDSFCSLPAGSAIIRDLRLWHGYLCGTGEILDPCQPVLPQTVHHTLSQFGQEISRRLVAFNEELASGEGWMINDVFGYHRHKQEAY